MTMERLEVIREAIREALWETGLRKIKGRVQFRVDSFGDRVEVLIGGKYYGIWDMVKQTWVD